MNLNLNMSRPGSTTQFHQTNNCTNIVYTFVTLHWRHNERDGVSNHQPHDCLLNCLFRRRSKKTSKFRVTGLCAGNSPVTGEFPARIASNAENVSIWWRHHGTIQFHQTNYYINIVYTFVVFWMMPCRWISYLPPAHITINLACCATRIGFQISRLWSKLHE